MTLNSKHRARVQAKPQRIRDTPRVDLTSVWDWRAGNPHLFPSDASLRWHLRKHRDAYIVVGALMEIAGRLYCDPPKFEQVLREVGGRLAAERSAAAEGALA